MIYCGQPALMSPLKGAAAGRLLNHRKEVMSLAKKVEAERTDVATFLGGLASRLRNDALALTGLAWRESHPGNADHEDLHGLAGSLERTAALLEAVKDRLCQTCQLLDVAEQVTFGASPEVGRKPRKKKGARTHGKEEGQERKGGRRKGRRR